MDNKERKYIMIFRIIAACSGMVLIGLIITAWVKEGWMIEWRQVQDEYLQLFQKSGSSIVSKDPSVEQGKQIKQLVLTDLGRTDRCITCHTGIDDLRFVAAKQPYKSHSGDYLRWHPVEQYGCTICHGGQGRAVTRHEAFGMDPERAGTHHFWNIPISSLPAVHVMQ